jgi:pyroglutamyl-peptidase
MKKIWIALFFFCIASFSFGQEEKPMRVLITGFEIFGGNEINPSEQLILFVQKGNNIPGFSIKAIILPVAYFECWYVLQKNIEEFDPDAVICFGYAPGSDKIRIESTAKNYDGGYLDNRQRSHQGIIVERGPQKYKSGLPMAKIQKELEKADIPVGITYSAGTYVCNHIFYQLMHYASQQKKIKAGFIHVPLWSVQGNPSLWKMLECVLGALKQ